MANATRCFARSSIPLTWVQAGADRDLHRVVLALALAAVMAVESLTRTTVVEAETAVELEVVGALGMVVGSPTQAMVVAKVEAVMGMETATVLEMEAAAAAAAAAAVARAAGRTFRKLTSSGPLPMAMATMESHSRAVLHLKALAAAVEAAVMAAVMAAAAAAVAAAAAEPEAGLEAGHVPRKRRPIRGRHQQVDLARHSRRPHDRLRRLRMTARQWCRPDPAVRTPSRLHLQVRLPTPKTDPKKRHLQKRAVEEVLKRILLTRHPSAPGPVRATSPQALQPRPSTFRILHRQSQSSRGTVTTTRLPAALLDHMDLVPATVRAVLTAASRKERRARW